MTIDRVQNQCELGQQELARCKYLEAEQIFCDAEQQAWALRDFDTLARLYMPLQEARRQRRQRCGEGEVCLDLCAQSASDQIAGRHVVENYPFGQLLVAGWASTEPARQVRRLQKQFGLYVETFLGAVYPTTQGKAIVIVPLDNDALPKPASNLTLDALKALLPPHCLVFREIELPRGSRQGSAQTYSEVMWLWEQLHTPFLAAADAETDPIARIEAYRKTIRVDYACELAHQRLADTARELARRPSIEPASQP